MSESPLNANPARGQGNRTSPWQSAQIAGIMPGLAPDALASVAPPSGRASWRIFPPILVPVFLSAVDSSIVASALPTIAAVFGEVGRVSWVIASYLVAATIAAPVYGRLGDAFGRRRMLMTALVIFIAASILCASAHDIMSLLGARVLQGFGGGGLMVLSQALLGENVSRRELGRAQGILAAIIVAAFIFGPVAAGVLTQYFGWSSIFLINIPLGAFAIMLALRLPKKTINGINVKFDWIGLILFAGFVVPLLLALEQFRHSDTFSVIWAFCGLGLSLLCLVLLLRQEDRVEQPLFVLKILRHAAIWRANAMAACSGALLVSEAALLPIHLQAVEGMMAIRVGLLMLPLTATVGIGSLITGWLISRTGYLAMFPSIGQTAAAIVLFLIAFGSWHFSGGLGPYKLPAMLAMVALFQGSAMPAAHVTVQSLVPPAMLGVAAAWVQLSRSIGSAVGVTVVVAALFATLGRDHDVAATFAQMVRHGPGVLTSLPDALRLTTVARIEAGFGVAFTVVAAFATLNALLAWSLPVRKI